MKRARNWVLLAIVVLAGCAQASPTRIPTVPPVESTAFPVLPTPSPVPSPTTVPTPLPTHFPLSGLRVDDPEALVWPPLAVMIPSDSEQYGLSQASVVYEVPMEGGIPRFLALYEDLDAERLGPIRSTRPYTVEWACPYGALHVHWGGSPAALSLLGDLACVANLEAMTYEGGYFWREEPGEVPWNNLYTSSALLRSYLENWELTRFVAYQGYPHKEGAPMASRPQRGPISFAFSYPVRYSYDRESNSYLRSYQGRLHVDLLTGEQIRVRNVVLVFVSQALIPDDPQGRLEITTVGEGEALVFLDGTAIEGRWVRPAVDAEMRFLDAEGQEIAFNRGNVWIEVLALGQEVDYSLGQPSE